MTYNFSDDSISVHSKKTGKNYELKCIGKVNLNDDVVNQITSVCREPEIYNNVFESIFKGKPYTLDNAKFFTNLLSDGWIKKDRFDWLIHHEGMVVGTIGIKSLEGEIGYWQSNKHPGVMSVAVEKVCLLAKNAGFSMLWAQVDKNNIASIKVLEKSGFTKDSNQSEASEEIQRFSISLQ